MKSIDLAPPPLKTLIWDLAAATLILLLPMVIFLHHNAYPLLQAETLGCLALVVLAGVFWGLVMWTGRTVGRVLVTALLLVLLVDLQTEWLTTFGLRFFLNVLGAVLLCWLLRKRLSLLMAILFGAMILGTALQPHPPLLINQGHFPGPGQGRQPFVMHLILDEYAACEALDRRYDPDGQVANSIESFFQDRGFTLFSRAYSRYYDTNESIPNLLNRGTSDQPNHFWPGDEFVKNDVLLKNDWFDRLHDLGYDLNLIQPDFIDFNSPEAQPVSLTRYTLETVHALAAAELPVNEKMVLLMGSYYRLSWILGGVRQGYSNLRSAAVGKSLSLPDWDLAGNRFSTLNTMQVIDGLESSLTEAKSGQAVFAHLLFPHYPYAYRADGTLKPNSRQWLEGADIKARPDRNSSLSRSLRYPMYLEQIQAANLRLEGLFEALEAAGVWDEAIIILHGDHGSRLNQTQPFPSSANRMSSDDYMDAFGTFLAIKWPQGKAGPDRRCVPIDDVFEQLFLHSQGSWPPGMYQPEADLVAQPWVFLNDRRNLMVKRPFPGFEAGKSRALAPVEEES